MEKFFSTLDLCKKGINVGMINEEYGRSAIKLIFTILILAIVITGIVFMAQRLWKDTSVKDIETDLLDIKAKCKIIRGKNIMDSNEQLLGENITEYPENEDVNEIISKSDDWYKLRQEDLEAIGVGNLKSEDGYLVNYEEEDIIYAKGIERDKQIYYRLSDLQRLEEESEQEEQNTELLENQETTEQDVEANVGAGLVSAQEEQQPQNPETEVLEGHDTVETNE